MHRRGISCVAELSSTAGTRRCASTSSNPRPPFRLPKKTYDRIESTTKLLAVAAAKGEARRSKYKKPYSGETSHTVDSKKPYQQSTILPSSERVAFYAEPEEQGDLLSDLSQLDVQKRERLPTGAFVELRRSAITVHGVIIWQKPTEKGWLMHVLVRSGEVWLVRESDVMFVVPDFVQPDLITQCGPENVDAKTHELAARVHILKKLRNFDLSLERQSPEYWQKLNKLYTQFKSSDPTQWASVTTNQVSQLLNPEAKTAPVATQLVVHDYMFDKSKYFEADQTHFLTTRTFWVRPQQHVQDIEAVDRMISQRDPVLDAFIEKARVVITAARQREAGTQNGHPTFKEDPQHGFTAEDLVIIRWFSDSLVPRRTFQVDPYTVSQSYIIKKLGLYMDKEVNDSTIHEFLFELGVLPPWEDRITRHSSLARKSQSRTLTLDVVDDSSSPRSLTRSTAGQPLGPEDFYSQDAVDSLRHDFGNMPVYVIDDVDAEELDDGISVESIPSEPGNHWLHVHIADPTSILPPTHVFAHRAFEQMETEYLVDRSYPMLSGGMLDKISLGSCEGQPQRVVSFSAKVDPEGNIIDYKVRPGIVRNVHIFQYDAVNDAMGWSYYPYKRPFGGEAPTVRPRQSLHLTPSVRDDLHKLEIVQEALTRGRLRNGMLTFGMPSAQLSLNPKPLPTVPPLGVAPRIWSGFPSINYAVQEVRTFECGARFVVAESMTTAGRVASRFFRDRGLPALRRTSLPPTPRYEGAYEEVMAARDPHGSVDSFSPLRFALIFNPAEYSIEPGTHSVLGIPEGEGYMRITSPLRRFPDLLAHWQIKHALLHPGDRASPPFSNEWLLAFARELVLHEERNKRLVRAQHAYWAHQFIRRWMAARQRGEPADGSDPLDNLVAWAFAPAVRNAREQYWQQLVMLPGLGLKGMLVGLKEEKAQFPIPGAVDVKIERVVMGLRPSVIVTQR